MSKLVIVFSTIYLVFNLGWFIMIILASLKIYHDGLPINHMVSRLSGENNYSDDIWTQLGDFLKTFINQEINWVAVKNIILWSLVFVLMFILSNILLSVTILAMNISQHLSVRYTMINGYDL